MCWRFHFKYNAGSWNISEKKKARGHKRICRQMSHLDHLHALDFIVKEGSACFKKIIHIL